MKRILLLTLVALFIAGATTEAKAQSMKYMFELHAGTGIGVGKNPMHQLQVNWVQGFRLGDNYSLGFGLGLDWHTADFREGVLMFPLYYNVKFYAPTNGMFKPFISASIGYGINSEREKIPVNGGLLFDIGTGFKINSVVLSIGYHMQQMGPIKDNVNLGALQFKIGIAI
ncbi:MAG: hypothetical protein IKY89_07085 [Alistipes sp.]|nr:hypothetical protein [Alistipes sp.]